MESLSLCLEGVDVFAPGDAITFLNDLGCFLTPFLPFDLEDWRLLSFEMLLLRLRPLSGPLSILVYFLLWRGGLRSVIYDMSFVRAFLSATGS